MWQKYIDNQIDKANFVVIVDPTDVVVAVLYYLKSMDEGLEESLPTTDWDQVEFLFAGERKITYNRNLYYITNLMETGFADISVLASSIICLSKWANIPGWIITFR